MYSILGVAILLIAFFLFKFNNKKVDVVGTSVWSENTATSSIPQVLSEENSNQFIHKYRNFSFRYPNSYKLSNFLDPNNENAEIILVQDAAKGLGFQIMITPFEKGINTLTVDRIKKDLPDLKIEALEVVELGSAGTGIAFKSDNESFDGSSREVWFSFNGYLYQISTYTRLDSLIQSVLTTWQFR